MNWRVEPGTPGAASGIRCIECAWCPKTVIFDAVIPDGWVVIDGSPGGNKKYCCHACHPIAFPENFDE